MASGVIVTRVGSGMYRVEDDGRSHIVYVAGKGDDRWAFWNGHVYRSTPAIGRSPAGAPRHERHQSLTSPMPATVGKILVEIGAAVHRGDSLILLEAMKMELPLRAEADGTVRRIHCREGDLVQPESVLIELD
jgi:biotin carboxyl carrier protein